MDNDLREQVEKGWEKWGEDWKEMTGDGIIRSWLLNNPSVSTDAKVLSALLSEYSSHKPLTALDLNEIVFRLGLDSDGFYDAVNELIEIDVLWVGVADESGWRHWVYEPWSTISQVYMFQPERFEVDGVSDGRE